MPRLLAAHRLFLCGFVLWIGMAFGQLGTMPPDPIVDTETMMGSAAPMDTTGNAAFLASKGHYRHPVDASLLVKPEDRARFDLSDPDMSVVYACRESCDVRLVADGILLKMVTLSPFSVSYVFGHGSYRTVYSGLTTRGSMPGREHCTAGSLLGRTMEQNVVFQVYRALPTGEIEELDARDWLQ